MLGYAFYWFLLSPQLTDYQAIQTQIKLQQQNLERVKRTLKEAAPLIQQDKQNKAQDRQLVLHPGNQGELVVRLNQLAVQNGLIITSFKPVASPQLLVPIQTVALEVTGPFEGIVGFFRVLESEPYFTRVDMHQLLPDSGGQQDVMKNSKVEFQLQVFNLP